MGDDEKASVCRPAAPENLAGTGKQLDADDKCKIPIECVTELQELSLQLNLEEGKYEDGDFTPKAECVPDISKNIWNDNICGSVDLDEKFTTMTGSYSEIFEDSHPEEKLSGPEQPEKVRGWSHKNRDDTLIDGALAALNSDNQELFSLGLSCMNKALENEQRASVQDIGERYACGLPNLLYGSHLARSCLYPQPYLVDPDVLTELEEYARGIASSMDSLTENLTDILHGISALTVDCVETYRNAVCKTCDAVDSNIKSMYQLMAKCEELSKAMKPVYKLHEQIKEIRRLLDLFENAVYTGGT